MRPRTLQATRVALAALVVLASGSGAAQAQVLVAAERDLDFGMVTPGMATVVAPTDVARSAQLRVQGRGTFQISFQLPASLSTAKGEKIPLLFTATDGQLTVRHRITVFDPNATTSFRVNPADVEAQINLGGRVQPASGQPAGNYSATIVIMVVQTGT